MQDTMVTIIFVLVFVVGTVWAFAKQHQSDNDGTDTTPSAYLVQDQLSDYRVDSWDYLKVDLDELSQETQNNLKDCKMHYGANNPRLVFNPSKSSGSVSFFVISENDTGNIKPVSIPAHTRNDFKEGDFEKLIAQRNEKMRNGG